MAFNQKQLEQLEAIFSGDEQTDASLPPSLRAFSHRTLIVTNFSEANANVSTMFTMFEQHGGRVDEVIIQKQQASSTIAFVKFRTRKDALDVLNYPYYHPWQLRMANANF